MRHRAGGLVRLPQVAVYVRDPAALDVCPGVTEAHDDFREDCNDPRRSEIPLTAGRRSVHLRGMMRGTAHTRTLVQKSARG